MITFYDYTRCLCLWLCFFFKSLLPIILLLNYTQLPLACVYVCVSSVLVSVYVCADDFYDFSKVQSDCLPSNLILILSFPTSSHFSDPNAIKS